MVHCAFSVLSLSLSSSCWVSMLGRIGDVWRAWLPWLCSVGAGAGDSLRGSGGLPSDSNGFSETVEEVNVSDAIKGLQGTDGLLWLSYVTCDLLVLAVGMPSMRRWWHWWRKCRENWRLVRSQLPWRQPGHGLFLEVMVVSM